MKNLSAVSLLLLSALGGALVVYGGFDDSPGAQFLGILVIIVSISGTLLNNRKS